MKVVGIKARAFVELPIPNQVFFGTEQTFVFEDINLRNTTGVISDTNIRHLTFEEQANMAAPGVGRISVDVDVQR